MVVACALVAARGLWVAGLRGPRALAMLAWIVPVLALAAAAWLCVWAAPRWVFLAVRGRGIEARAHARRSAWVLAFVAAAAITERTVQRDVDARMEAVVSAVERYRADRGHFPVRLRDVTPRYLREIPSPWPLNRGCGYAYLRTGERVMLLRDNLDDRGQQPCAPQHGLRYRFLTLRWENW